jgi:hypothetical protein
VGSGEHSQTWFLNCFFGSYSKTGDYFYVKYYKNVEIRLVEWLKW